MAEKAKNKNSMWKLAIIVIVILLLVFLAGPSLIGIPGGGGPLTSFCIAQSNYTCGAISYSHITGNVTLVVGQSTGIDWTLTSVYFVPQGAQMVNGTPTIVTSEPGNVIIGGLPSGETASVTLPVSSTTNMGAKISGSIWVKYQTSSAGLHYIQLATIHMSAI